MDLQVLAAAKFDHIPIQEEVKEFAGKCARICYLPGTLAKVLEAPLEKSLSVAELTLQSGHHSVYDHVYVSLALEQVPKVLAMTLNNEHAYTTSEQSGRYTKLTSAGVAAELYQKWQKIFFDLFCEKMPGIPEKKAEKLSLENARYFLSIFSPTTTMAYTCSVRQLNYLYNWMARFCAEEVVTDFEKRLQVVLQDFCWSLLENCDELLIPGLADNKRWGLSLLTEWRKRRMLQSAVENGFVHCFDELIAADDPNEWGVRGYSTTYQGSFAQFAQAHRHRTLHYEMRTPEAALAGFYIPPILPDELVGEWLDDMEQVRYEYPQGMLVQINESGRVEDLVRKCQERVCGEAQLEICAQTMATVQEYYREAMWNGGPWFNFAAAAVLQPYIHATGCKRMKLSGHRCKQPCWWIKHGYEIEERFA